ncbi:arsenic transporter [Campylobacter coli]|uniref:arsenic transporter n=1 Tax=Campylobacter coli TaxID=195 RepID=UPI001282CC56|nr:arsenic transporter [Campylobacter coli]EAL0844163.1 arsenic transporter [Campylobacter coli]ECC1296293.1 arsenic transporter [Campylobacter coli]EGL6275343.1 arsenic transporter [Campylobacter coli]ELW0602150.1 arsenic transporter [Campylobacter coli]
MLAFFIFLSTLVLLFWRPWNLPIWVFSSLGAFFVFIFQLVDFKDACFVFSLVWDSSLTLVGLIILSFSLEALGFFDFIASKILYFSREKNQEKIYISTKKMMLFLLIFVFFLSAFFANDGAILIITPIVLALFSTLKNYKESAILSAFLLSVSFLCDASSNALIISNLTNIITANYFNLDFLEFAKTMFLPNLFVLLSTIIMVFLIFAKILPKGLEINILSNDCISVKLFIFCVIYLIFFVSSFFIGEIYNLNASFFAVSGALLFWFFVCFLKKREALKIIKNVPWGIFAFSFGLYMVVFALHKVGISDILIFIYDILAQNAITAIFGTGFISAFLSSVFNNLPMALIGDLALKNFPQSMVYAHLLGVNIGPKLTPIGSLATLLWLGLLAKKGIEISFWKYCKFGFLITLPVLTCSLFALVLQY